MSQADKEIQSPQQVHLQQKAMRIADWGEEETMNWWHKPNRHLKGKSPQEMWLRGESQELNKYIVEKFLFVEVYIKQALEGKKGEATI